MRLTVGLFAAAVTALIGSSAAFADDLEDTDVEVEVEITQGGQAGTLAMTVDGTKVTLSEDGSDATRLQFKGTLPTVTVTDNREATDVDPDASWAVMGIATDFVGDDAQPNIPGENLGWSPAIVGDDANGAVSAGGDVGTAIDDSSNDGLAYTFKELLFMADNSADLIGEGDTWQANAELVLHAPIDQAEGTYTSELTLTLME
jgi:hypothetical protein